MRIKDLVDLVSFQHFYDTCRTKLNGTFVMYDNEWGYCEISDGPYYTENDQYEYGNGKEWVHITHLPTKPSDVHLNTLDDVETEITWPEMGYYWWGDSAYKLIYPTTHIYKAGLSPSQLSLTNLGNMDWVGGISGCLGLLNHIKKEGVKYPTLKEAEDLLLSTNNRQVPISMHSLIEAYPYSEYPVVSWGNVPVGVARSGKLFLTPSNKPLEEYFNHIGVPNA